MFTTLIQRFWMHVTNRPNSSFLLLKDPADRRSLNIISWRRAGLAVTIVMDFLRERGIKKGDRVAILGWNTPEWVVTDLAIQSLGAVTVPIYPNSSAEQVNYILNDCGAKLTFSNDEAQLAKVNVGVARNFASIADLGKVLGYPTMGEVETRSQSLPGEFDFDDIGASDLATLIYTSGSSGTPKGCKISHGNLSNAVSGVTQMIALDGASDVYLSYLPLAHVYERINGVGLCIWNAVSIAFSPVDKVAEHLAIFKPTLLCGVPAVWEKMRANIYAPKKGLLPTTLNRLGLWKPLLDFAIGLKKGGFLQRVIDAKLFKPIRQHLGGRLKLLVSGGAPIAPETLHFFNQLGLEILEGYGATETTSGAVSNRPASSCIAGPKNKVGSVGLPLPGVELRVVMDPEEEELGLGEIQVRGGQIFAGYWNLPEETAAAFTADGWFRMGDLGRVDEDGFVYVSGRMNGMYKTTGGKFVCREKLEQALKPFPIVQYSVPVAHGRKFATVLIFVNQQVAEQIAGKCASGTDAMAFYATHPQVLKAVEDAITGANNSLQHWERMQYFRIIPLAATVENGIITETLKIRSKVLLKRFDREIEELYSGADTRKKT